MKVRGWDALVGAAVVTGVLCLMVNPSFTGDAFAFVGQAVQTVFEFFVSLFA